MTLNIDDIESHPEPSAPDVSDELQHSAQGEDHPHLSLGVRILNTGVIIVPFAGLAVAVFMLWGRAFNWLYLALLVGMYLVTAIGITVGFHRLFTHKSFSTNVYVKSILAVMGSMAFQGPLFEWVATHRRHHQHSDDHDDPHSPHFHGDGVIGSLLGLWRAHAGWLFEPDAPDLDRYVVDLKKSKALRKINSQFVWLAIIGLFVPAGIAGLITGTWEGALLGFLWGGLARVFFGHHITWSINSICHFWGSRPFRSHDESRNNLIFGILGLGEGWHNNHHAFPTSARHGLRWWQIDMSYWLILGMQAVGLATNVKTPSMHALDAKRR